MQAHAEASKHAAFRTKHPGNLAFEKVLGDLAIITIVELLISNLHSDGKFGVHQTLSIAAILQIFKTLVKPTLDGG